MTLILHENRAIDTANVGVAQHKNELQFTSFNGAHVRPMKFESEDRAKDVINLIASAIHCGTKILDLDIK